MKLLKISHANSSPWAHRVDTEVYTLRQVCSACGIEEQVFHGPATIEMEDGSCWPDVIGGDAAGNSRLLISDRVLQQWRDNSLTGFEAFPVEFRRISSKKLRDALHSQYYILYAAKGISFEQDFLLESIPEKWRCPNCKALRRNAPQEYRDRVFKAIQWQQRYRPIEGTWNGADLFCGHNGPKGFYCTERVIELAHQHRWTNFRFNMIDAVRRHANGWAGIDYLSKTWPPKRWYPPAPSEGKTMDEWLDMLRTEPFPSPTNESRAQKAWQALLDFGEDVVPALWQLIAEGNDDQRKNAAESLRWLRREIGIPLTDDERQRIVDIRPDISLSALR